VWVASTGRLSTGWGKLLALVLGVVVLVGAVTGGIVHLVERQSPVAIQSPAVANSKLYAAAAASGSFHYVNSSLEVVGGRTETSTSIGDAGRDQGVQYMIGAQGAFEVIVVDSMAYMKADLSALENVLGLSPTVAAPYVDRWISLAPTDAPYKAVAADVTSETTWDDPATSVTDALPQQPASVSGLFMLNGRSVQSVIYLLQGSDGQTGASYAGTEIAIFAATDPHLPSVINEHLSGTVDQQPSTEGSRVSFSRWGELVSVKPPTQSIPYSSLPPATSAA
jgi:hypothetical protein